MPKLDCLCGEVIELHTIPNEQEFSIVPDILRESLIDKVVAVHNQGLSKQEFERKVYQSFTHLTTPGILSMIECPACHRLAVFARASDSIPMFWFRREQTNFMDMADSLRTLVERLRQEDMPPDWQQQLK